MATSIYGHNDIHRWPLIGSVQLSYQPSPKDTVVLSAGAAGSKMWSIFITMATVLYECASSQCPMRRRVASAVIAITRHLLLAGGDKCCQTWDQGSALAPRSRFHSLPVPSSRIPNLRASPLPTLPLGRSSVACDLCFFSAQKPRAINVSRVPSGEMLASAHDAVGAVSGVRGA